MSTDPSSGTIVKPSELTPYERWQEEIKQAELELKDFHNRGNKVNRRFLDERDLLQTGNKWFNIYYANTNILKAALYAQIPKPAVSRRFKDYEDDTARVAALILERSITQDLDDPRDTYDSTMHHCVQDRLIPGLAAAWLRLETDTAEIPYESINGEEAPANYEPQQEVTDQRICVDYVYWRDFIWSPCRIWCERRWTGRIAYMDRDALIKRFPKVGEKVPLDFSVTAFNGTSGDSTPSTTPKHMAVKQARIYEIWDRTTKKVFWLSKNYPEILDEKDDPLHLVGFEPCPEPMLANITTSNTCPRPDYYMIQDQYTELDVLNNRISMLLQACKVVGVYDKSAEGVQRMLNEGFDNQLIPVDNWAMFAEKGGIKGQVDWLPLDVVVVSLTQLINNRELIKQQIYELTGISDIVRGATKASETLGAQEIKSKFASISIKTRQDEVAKFAAEILRIKAELMIKHFTPEMIVKKSNIEATGAANQQFVQSALDMLQSEDGFEWKIEVTADSIAQADYAMEKADRMELLGAVSGYLEKFLPMLQAFPLSASIMVSMLKWAIAGFRNASEIEGLLDQELDKLSKAPPAPPPPNPEQQKAQAEQQKMQAEMQRDDKKFGMEQQKMQAEMAMKQKMNEMELQMKQMELTFKMKELDLKEREMQMKMDFSQQEAIQKQRASLAEQQMSLDAEAQRHEQEAAFTQETHEQGLEQSAAVGEQKVAQAKAAAKAAPKPAAKKGE
jgi:hypothetical protein